MEPASSTGTDGGRLGDVPLCKSFVLPLGSQPAF